MSFEVGDIVESNIDLWSQLSRPLLVGITGYARSGKDTIGGALIREFGFEQRAFAWPLRDALLALNPFVDEDWRLKDELERHFWDWEQAKEGLLGNEIRSLLQRMGTEAGRDVHGTNVWVNALFKEPITQDTVITDVRFLSEAEAIKERGGLIIRVRRDGVGPANSHASETELDSIEHDLWVNNNGTERELIELTGAIMRAIRWARA